MRTEAPLPRFTGLWCTRTPGTPLSKRFNASRVPSEEPSLTTMISFSTPSPKSTSRTLSMTAPTVLASLKTGMMMESFKAATFSRLARCRQLALLRHPDRAVASRGAPDATSDEGSCWWQLTEERGSRRGPQQRRRREGGRSSATGSCRRRSAAPRSRRCCRTACSGRSRRRRRGWTACSCRTGWWWWSGRCRTRSGTRRCSRRGCCTRHSPGAASDCRR